MVPHSHATSLEALLMQKMDKEILQAEESDWMERLDASIRRAEQREQKTRNGLTPLRKKQTAARPSLLFALSPRPSSPWLMVAEQLQKGHSRRRSREEAAQRCYYDPLSVEGLEYVLATKLIPRHLGARWKTRKQLEDYFMRKFHRGQNPRQLGREDPIFFKGFRLRLCSANPSAWRLHVYGYRTTVDAFLLCLAGIFDKALQKQQHQKYAPLVARK